MLSKRGLGYDPTDRANTKRLRANVSDLLLSNEVSATRARSVFEDAQLAGAAHVADLASTGNHGRCKGNIARDVLAKLLKRNQWPKPYYAKIRVFDRKTQATITAWLPILLPHELLHCLSEHANREVLHGIEELEGGSLEHFLKAKQQLGGGDFVPVALWGDGVPCNYDRTESLEAFTLSLPGLKGPNRLLRIPLACLTKKFVIKEETFDDILEVIAWSFRVSSVGLFPATRHDGACFLKSDLWRSKRALRPLGSSGILTEIRGDWVFYKSCFRLPAWNENAGCCWRCDATPQDIRDCSLDAAWRTSRLSHWDFIARLILQGKTMSPILRAPCVEISCFKIDWLHTMDIGVAADVLGNILLMLLPKMGGASASENCKRIFIRMRAWYKNNPVDSKYDNLIPTMIQKKASTPPKLRGKAAEVRSLVPFVKLLAEEFFSDADIMESTAKEAAKLLNGMYECLSAAAVFSGDHLAERCRKLCLLWVAMEAQSVPPLWRVKPKMHLVQELCEMSIGDRPALSWTYRDEEFGGSLAQYARKRGGHHTPIAIGRAVLLKFIAKHPIPRIV
jgi:hypothetical protein